MTSPLYSPYAHEPRSNDDIMALMDNQAIAEEVRRKAKVLTDMYEWHNRALEQCRMCSDAYRSLEELGAHLDEAITYLSTVAEAFEMGEN